MKITRKSQRSYPTAPRPTSAPAQQATVPAPQPTPPPSGMTEDDAANCWCPFVRVPFMPTQASVNRAGDGLKDPGQLYRCIGSRCMAWRWVTSAGVPSTRGFCSLAGTPWAGEP